MIADKYNGIALYHCIRIMNNDLVTVYESMLLIIIAHKLINFSIIINHSNGRINFCH